MFSVTLTKLIFTCFAEGVMVVVVINHTFAYV